MNTMYWANFLHIYQPPTQKPIWVRRITDESYRKIFSGLLKIKRAKITLNINSVLCELLDKYNGKDVLKNIKTLLKNGNLELTGSAKYHAFLPLLPESEIERQIVLNEAGLQKYFGPYWKKSGFFSPEMAYSKKVARTAKKLGYKWIIIDELAFPNGHPKDDTIYTIEGIKDFSVFFRERNLSFRILSATQISTMPVIMRFLEPRLQRNQYTVTAMDGETFGHHRPGLENLLFDILKEKSFTPVTVSELSRLFPQKQSIEPRESTWASMPRDFEYEQPFLRWHNKNNQIQEYQWQLTYLAIKVINRNTKQKARQLLDEAIHSDQYWWASASPWWSLEMIERGAYELCTAIVKSSTATAQEKLKAKKLYQKILYTGFNWQRSGLVDEMAIKANEEIQEILEAKQKLYVSKAEYQDMIKTLTEQMRLAASAEEYHRAAMIKDRIREIREEMEKDHRLEDHQPAEMEDLMM